jgi:hypothetical protein
MVSGPCGVVVATVGTVGTGGNPRDPNMSAISRLRQPNSHNVVGVKTHKAPVNDRSSVCCCAGVSFQDLMISCARSPKNTGEIATYKTEIIPKIIITERIKPIEASYPLSLISSLSFHAASEYPPLLVVVYPWILSTWHVRDSQKLGGAYLI